jgi:C4-dicarboxylate-specific signal transduction histidine kinase
VIGAVAICAPIGRDAAIVQEILRTANIRSVLADPTSLPTGIAASEYAAVLLTEEAVGPVTNAATIAALAAQPPWSDLPFIVLTSPGPPPSARAAMLRQLGNVVQVARPVHPAGLIELVRNARRARARQVEARRYLKQIQDADLKLEEFAAGLERQITHRTRALTAANRRLAAQAKEQIEAQERLNQVQSELIHVSRVSAMDTMASTLAHELNQPLTAVTNYLHGSIRLLERGSISDDVRDGLEQALASAHRAGEIVRRIRDLVSRGVVARKAEDLPKLIDEAIAVALVDAAVLGTTHRLVLDPRVRRVLVDRVQIQQVLINLLRNAVEAVAGSETREIIIATNHLNDATVEVSVSDTGHGLPAEVLSTLFSSFKTTKQDGMGVGLSICRTIVEANGGTISGANLAKRGAVFRFTLPQIGRDEGEHRSFPKDADQG